MNVWQLPCRITLMESGLNANHLDFTKGGYKKLPYLEKLLFFNSYQGHHSVSLNKDILDKSPPGLSAGKRFLLPNELNCFLKLHKEDSEVSLMFECYHSSQNLLLSFLLFTLLLFCSFWFLKTFITIFFFGRWHIKVQLIQIFKMCLLRLMDLDYD